MGYASIRSGTEALEIPCSLCGVNVVRDAKRNAKGICLICQAAILNRIFQVRRERAEAQEQVGNARSSLKAGVRPLLWST